MEMLKFAGLRTVLKLVSAFPPNVHVSSCRFLCGRYAGILGIVLGLHSALDVVAFSYHASSGIFISFRTVWITFLHHLRGPHRG